MRLFVALKLSELVLDRLSKTTRELKTHAVSGRFSHRENLHLTLGREVILEPDFDLRAFFAGQDHCTMQVERVSLMKSERISGKLVYTEIAFVGLNNNSYTK